MLRLSLNRVCRTASHPHSLPHISIPAITPNYCRTTVAHFSDPSTARGKREVSETEEEQTTKLKVMYEETSSRNIRAMIVATGINLTYWGFNSSLTIYNNFMAGVPFGSGIFGGAELDTFLLVASTALVGATKLYADHSVMKVYENFEANRVGFQVHTLLGFPGKYLEVPIGNTAIEDGGKSGMVGVRVVGMHRPLILPNSDKFRDCEELHELLQRKKVVSPTAKRERIGWKKKAPRGMKNIKL
jgi:hypothetical protein